MIYIVIFSNLAILVLAMQMVFFYFKYIFKMGQVPQEVNGRLILVVNFLSVNKVVYGNGIITISWKAQHN